MNSTTLKFRTKHLRFVCVFSMSAILIVGCGGQNNPRERAEILGKKAAGGLVPVSGTLLIDGKPEPEVWIRLAKKGDPRVPPNCPKVRTDAAGKFVFSTNVHGDGIEPGSYVLLIEWLTKQGSASWGPPDKLLNNFSNPVANEQDPRFVLTVEGSSSIKIPPIELSTAGLQEVEPHGGSPTRIGKPVRR